ALRRGDQQLAMRSPRRKPTLISSAAPLGETYLFSANGALFRSAWGNAPGIWTKKVPAVKARVINAMSRVFSAHSYFQSIFLGRYPRLGLKSALSALSTHRFPQGKISTACRVNNLFDTY